MSEVFLWALKRPASDKGDGYDYRYKCPGCRCEHSFRVRGFSPRHTLSGDLSKPTIEPELVFDWGSGRCVATIFEGVITYSSDSTHRLAGQSVPMEAI